MNRRRNISALKIALIGLPLALVLVLVSSAWWLLRTPSGGAWLWDRVKDGAAGSIHSSRVNGNLASGFTIEDFEYLSESVELSVRQLEIQAAVSLWPLSIQVSSLVLRDMDITSLSAGAAVDNGPGDVQIQSALEALRMPVVVYVHAAEISHVTLRADQGAPVIVAELLSFSAVLDDRLVVEQLAFQTPGIEARLDGRLALEPPFAVSVAGQGRIESQGSASAPGLVFPFRLESSGVPGNLPFTLNSTGSGLELGAERLGLAVSGRASTTGVQLDRMTLAGSAVSLEAAGALDWSSHKQAGLTLQIHQLDLSPWLAAWPAGQQLLGKLELDWSDAGLKIPHGRLGLAGTGLMVNLAADIDVEDNTIDALLDWRYLAWPLADASPLFSSPSGRLSVNGRLDHWEATGELDIRMRDYPQGHLEILGAGNRTSAHLTIPGGQVLGGTISGKAGADWQDGLAWDIHARARGINPEPVLPGWPGRLDAELEASADNRSEGTRIRLASLSGSMRGVPLTGHGGFKLTGGAVTLESVTFDEVQLSTDEAVLRLDGTAANPAGVRVELSGHLPSILLQGAAGNVELAGRYSSAASNSLLDVQLQAHDLAWNGFSVRELAVTSHADGQAAPIPGLKMEASGLAWRGTPLDALSLVIEPAGEQYRLSADLVTEKTAMHTAMTLTPVSTQDPFNHPWQGVLDRLVLAANHGYRFELQEQASLEWGSGTVSLSPVCMRENGGARFCVNGDYKSSSDWSLVADVTTVPLDYLRDIFGLNVRFEQVLEGRLEWRQSDGRAPAGGAEFTISPGRILDHDAGDVLTESSEGRFGFNLVDGNLEAGVLDIEFPGTGFIDVDFKVLDITENGGGHLQGRAVARLVDLGLFGQLVLPRVDGIDGQFESKIQLGGSLASPSFDGAFKLSNGLVRYTPIGLKLDNIEIEGLLEKSNRGNLKGRFRAGDGVGSVDGHILFEDINDIQAEVSLSGDRLLLVSTDDLQINTGIDLRIGLAPQRVDINGYIRIPDARLTPTNLLMDRVSDSEDLVIEGPAAGPTTGVENKPPAHLVYGQLEVAFGDDVFIAVPDIETRISGSVLYQWQGGPVPMADGSYRLNGKVDVYGPSLEITNGSISFPGVPANNPLLNIRAERNIFGNTQIRSAGVQLIGTLKRPVLEAYTVPLTNEDRAWTLLVTGTDFDQGQGVGGFDVGTYIAPKLYVSYGISLFEDENIISARYDLKKGFGVKISSGQRETGVDASYTIDR